MTKERDLLERKCIFIASPGGHETERAAFKEVIDEVNETKAKSQQFYLEAHGWEDMLPGKGRPQEIINEDLKKCGLVVMCLGERWGTPTGKYSSGFEEEFEVAKAEGKEIWLYFRDVDAKMLQDPGPQLKKVLKFKKKIEASKEFFYKRYENAETWKDTFRMDLARWLDGQEPLSATFGQSEDYEQRVKELEKTVEEKDKALLGKAQQLAKTAYELAKDGQLTKAEELFANALSGSPDVNILTYYSLFLMQIGSLDKAAQQYQVGLRLAKASGDRYAEAMVTCNLAFIYEIWGNLNIAEKMHLNALEIFKVLEDKKSIAAEYGNLGSIYSSRSDLKEAEKMYRKALEIHEALSDKKCIAADYSNLGIIYRIRGHLDNAEKMYRKALEIDETLGLKEGMAIKCYNLGLLEKQKGDLEKALEWMKKSRALYEALGAKPDIKDAKEQIELIQSKLAEGEGRKAGKKKKKK